MADVFLYVVDHLGDPRVRPRGLVLESCKPVIRRCARAGDWVVGFLGMRFGARAGRLCYVAQVAEHGASDGSPSGCGSSRSATRADRDALVFGRFLYAGNYGAAVPAPLRPVLDLATLRRGHRRKALSERGQQRLFALCGPHPVSMRGRASSAIACRPAPSRRPER